MDRRKFITGKAIPGKFVRLSAKREYELPYGFSSYNLMKEVMKYRKIDAHSHVDLGTNDLKIQESRNRELIDYADRQGIDKVVISKPVVTTEGTPEQFRQANEVILRAVRQYSGRFIGQFTFNPEYPKESFEEIRRYVDQGLIGAKLWNHVKINNSLFYPLIEKFIDLKMIIFMHAECQIGVGGYRMKYNVNKGENTSTPEDFADIAKRYPEAMFQYAHIGGGGDWEYVCKALKDSPNVYVDTSGSNNEEHMIDFAVRYLGEDRVIFGSNFGTAGVGKILASNLNESQRKKIFFENYNSILKKGGYNID